MAIALLDSSALVAYLVSGDTLHPAAVDAIESTVREGRSLAVSAVTWAEVLHGAQLGHLDEAAIREFAEDFGVTVIAVDVHVAEAAAHLQGAQRRRRGARGLRTPDALILATSLVNDDIDVVIGGDGQWPRTAGLDARIILLRQRR